MNGSDPTAPRRSGSGAFWITALALIAYVALATPHRDAVALADAWEHERAIVALTRDLHDPGNPTFLSDLPSVRYSPYSVGLALVCRATGLAPYDALSIAAVVNTALLLLGIRLLLGVFGEAPAAAAAVVTVVGLYGGAPGYANSCALADLPWHQVNPSAFAFAVALLGFAWARWATERGRFAHWIALGVVAGVALLDHPMTGAFELLGLLLIAWFAPDRRRALAGLALAVALACAVALAWPWYSFAAALRWRGDVEYWFNSSILVLALAVWPAPAAACALVSLRLLARPLVRFCAAGALAAFAIGALAFVARSPTLARFPLPGILFLQLPVGLLLHRMEVLSLARWRVRLRALVSADVAAQAPAAGELVVAGMLLWGLAPQLASVAREPHLLRPTIAGLLGREAKYVPRRKIYAELLRDVGDRDVVLADATAGWPVPSFHGRIVTAEHFELLVPDQAQRSRDVEAFFAPADGAGRLATLRRYSVRWIVLDRERQPPPVVAALDVSDAEVRTVGPLTLLDAERCAKAWERAGSGGGR